MLILVHGLDLTRGLNFSHLDEFGSYTGRNSFSPVGLNSQLAKCLIMIFKKKKIINPSQNEYRKFHSYSSESQWIVLVCGENHMKLFFFIES